jgi:hypothetical protein
VRSRSKWEVNSKMCSKEIGFVMGRLWIVFSVNRTEDDNMTGELRFLWKGEMFFFLTTRKTVSLSQILIHKVTYSLQLIPKVLSIWISVIWGFLRVVNEVFTLLGGYAALIGSYRIFRTAYQSHPLKLGTIGCPETSVIKYQSTLHNIAEERRTRLN